MKQAEDYFKRCNGYVQTYPKQYQEYLSYHIDHALEEKWTQELIQKHIDELYHKEVEIWIHLSILVDLLELSDTQKLVNARRLIFELRKLRFLPVWNMLLILKPLVSSENCLLKQVKAYPVLADELIEIVDKYLPYNMENEHENFVERYRHILEQFKQNKESSC